MKRTLTTLFLCLTLTVVAMAQDKPAPAKAPDTKPAALPSADQIVTKYVQAVGGKAAIEKLNSRQTKGTFDLPAMGVSAGMEAYAKAPNKSAFTIDVPGFGLVQRGYNGTVGWESNPQNGLRDLSGNELAQMKLGAEFYRDVKLQQLFPKMTVKGIEKVGGQDAYVVEATSAEGIMQKMFFDAQSGLIVRAETEADTPQGKMAVTVLYSDYRDVDGVKIPFTTEQKSAAIEFVIKLESVKHNVPIDDAKFNKPAAQ
jgi:hypothetical protein